MRRGRRALPCLVPDGQPRLASQQMQGLQDQYLGPSNVNIEGTLITYTAGFAYATFNGTLTDVSPGGRSYDISARGPGGGLGIVGSYGVSGTVAGFDSLDDGFSIHFWTANIGPASFGGATIRNKGGTVGIVSVNGEFSVGLGGAGIGFRNVTRTPAEGGGGC